MNLPLQNIKLYTSSKQTLWTFHSQGWQGQESEIKKLTKIEWIVDPFLAYLSQKMELFADCLTNIDWDQSMHLFPGDFLITFPKTNEAGP